MSFAELDAILHPESVAVYGASSNPVSWGYSYTHHLINYGFKGTIYPVNPRRSEILGIKAYPSLKEVPGSVDFVISCVPAEEVPQMLEECAQKQVKGIHFFTARFSETGRAEDARKEAEILSRVKELGIRIIGPNCMGIYHPRHGMSLGYGLPKEPGKVGVAAQTGGGASGLVRLAAMRGVRFSKVISYGNAIDLNECDYLDYFYNDPETEIILMYIEGVRDGRRFLDLLREVAKRKPVIIAKGGRGQAGERAVASHTASLAGSRNTWQALIAQTGAISAENMEEMADLATSFYFLPSILGDRVGIVGAGGGYSVLTADECEEAGLDVVPLPNKIRLVLKEKGLQIWDWIGNPMDISILGRGGVNFTSTDMLHMMAENANFDLLMAIINEDVLATIYPEDGMISRVDALVENYSRFNQKRIKPLVAIVREETAGTDDSIQVGREYFRRMRIRLIDNGIPFYSTGKRAAGAIRKLIEYYRHTEV